MAKLADGEEMDLETVETELSPGMEVEGVRPPSPGGTGDPVVFDDEDEA
jgi:hypothetical protein